MTNTLAREDPGAPMFTCSKASIVCGTPSSRSSTSLELKILNELAVARGVHIQADVVRGGARRRLVLGSQ